MDASDLPIFLERFQKPDLIKAISSKGGCGPKEVERLLAIYRNEVMVGFGLVSDQLKPELRILEVGAGLCMLSLYLRLKGYDVTALEPVGSGFSFFEAALPEIISAVPEVDLPLLRIRGENLDPAAHGAFDLIFSVNVLEHIPDLPAVFRGMTQVLSQHGAMIHLCPNYLIPYEPHFARPLLPFAPRLSRPMMGSIERLPGVWESLNFIDYGQVKRLARQNGLRVSFESGLMARAVRRLRDDREYADRHKSTLLRFAASFGGLQMVDTLLRRLPASLATPMQFRLFHDPASLSGDDRNRGTKP